jgi:hypothetical protein
VLYVEMGTLGYDITAYQLTLFAADGIEQLLGLAGGLSAGLRTVTGRAVASP